MRVLTHAPGPCPPAKCAYDNGRSAMKPAGDRIEDIEELFDQADADNDDQISLTEFRGLMQELAPQMGDNVVATRFLEIDTNHDGCIAFGEFRAWWLNA